VTAYGNPKLRVTYWGDHIPVADALRMTSQQATSAALRVLEADGGHLRSEQQDRLARTVEARLSPENPSLDGDYVARRMLITESPEYRSAFMRLLIEPHPLLTEAEVQAVRAFQHLEATHEARAMGEVTPSAGGVGVPTLIDPSILLTAGAEAAPLLQAARVVPVTTNVWKGVTSAGVSFVFQTEAATVTDGSPTLAQPSVTVHMARAFVPYSIEVGQDYPGFAAEMQRLLEQGWVDALAAKTITGTGTGEPWGLLTRLDATTASEIRATTAGTLDATQVFKVWNALPERFRSRARWLMSVSEESQIRSFGAGPNPSAYFTVDLTQDGISRINGRPNMVTDYMPAYSSTTGTTNHMIVGDMSNYLIAMRQGLTVEPVPLVFATGGFPTGQRGFFAWGRFGADAVNTSGFRLLNQT
jgi:HK97 family phage major capsid protein